MTLEDLKRQYIRAIYSEKAFQFKEEYVTLHHGGESHLYLNHNQFLSRFQYLDLLCTIYQKMVPVELKEYKLGAVDSVMSPVLCGLLSAKLRKDVVVTKEKKLGHGLQSNVYGNAEGNVVLVDDVTSTGAILVNAAAALREKGAIVTHAILSACRDKSAIETLDRVKIRAIYVATYEEIVRNLWDTMTEAQRHIVMRETTEKHYDWSVN